VKDGGRSNSEMLVLALLTIAVGLMATAQMMAAPVSGSVIGQAATEASHLWAPRVRISARMLVNVGKA
jgi:hypothetical protein